MVDSDIKSFMYNLKMFKIISRVSNLRLLKTLNNNLRIDYEYLSVLDICLTDILGIFKILFFNTLSGN